VSQRLEFAIGREGKLTRLGGDEFGFIHTALKSADDTLKLSQRIIESLAQPFSIFGSEAFVGVSVGIVIAEPDAVDASDLTRKADIALYEAKSSGRNRAVIYQEVMDQLVQGRHTIEAELRDALRRGDQLRVVFQPLYGREPGQVVGAEALARWTHPKLGVVSPARFIPVAESSGLIEALGELVLREACRVGARWPGRTMAVNISPAQLRNPKFFGRVFDVLATTGMRPSDLELEITEGILLEDERVTTEALRRFRAAGIRIALDDFGTGYSSLGYLKQYAVDRIKIDRAFVSQLPNDDVSVAIVRAMISLAHAMGIAVTAEGVESREQMAVLLDMDCNTFQGYLLSAPVPAQAIDEIFAIPEPLVAKAG
jgi:predicted signal transduction protein with EAL and GGDEF domain